ncbi:MAG: hypothetical protein HFH30_09995 [Eubacterium sp.]|nr:hypothetical protein [Eubacterium sp.]
MLSYKKEGGQMPKTTPNPDSRPILKSIFKDGSTSATRIKFTHALADLINQLEKPIFKTNTDPELKSNLQSDSSLQEEIKKKP